MLQLTPTQRDIYLEGKLFGGAVNNIGGYQKFFCALDTARFARARARMLQGNDAYALRFSEIAGGCVPLAAARADAELALIDFSTEADAAAAALGWIRQRFETPFADLAQAVFEDALLKISAAEYWYYAKAHHLIMDGWGFALQMQRCLRAYDELAVSAAPDASGPSFIAYIGEQAGYAQSAQYADSRQHWLAEFDTLPRAWLAPKRNVAPHGACSARVSATLEPDLFRALGEVARKAGANVVAVFYAVLFVYFSRAYGSEDLVIGSPVHNRRNATEKDIIGSLVNVNAHRLSAPHDTRLVDLVKRVAQLQKKNHRHSRFPIGDLVRALRERFPQAGGNLYSVAFNYQKLDFGLTIAGHAVQTHYLSHNREQVPLTFVVCEYGPEQEVALHLDYRTDYFDAGEADALLARVHGLLLQAASDAERPLDRYRLPTEAEWRRLTVEWNDTAAPLRADVCLHQWFEQQAQRTPERVALACGAESLSYRELDARAERIARRLRELGAGPDRFVAVCHSRTPNLIAAMLGILKAGAAYVPLDPAYPAARIAYMLEDAGVDVVLADVRGATALPPGAHRVLHVTDVLAAPESPHAAAKAETPAVLTPAHLAYVIYTSGSTGKPKGVLIEHRNASAFVQWALGVFTADDLDAVLAATSVCFDLSVFEMFVPLAAGGRVVLADNVLALRGGGFDGISLINTVPSAIKAVLEAGAIPRSVRCINLAGELLRQDLVDALYRLPGVRVHDLYGPSEDTTYSTWCLRRAGGVETIGRPIANTQAYVLDAHGDPLPPGLVGELHLGGAGLARGYLNQPEMTAQKFAYNDRVGARLYGTGDLVRFGAGGDVHYVGRMDNQVKVRGYRIELGEIETRALQHPAIAECAVLARDDVAGATHRTIVAYWVAADAVAGAAAEQALTDDLTRWLADALPAYMLPSLFVRLPALPLSANGKTDRKALPLPAAPAESGAGRALPRSATERALAALWRRLLQAEAIGVHDNFFTRGGDSLLLMRLATSIEAEFEATLDLSDLFAHPTLEGQAGLIDRACRLGALLDALAVDDAAPQAGQITL